MTKTIKKNKKIKKIKTKIKQKSILLILVIKEYFYCVKNLKQIKRKK